MTKTSNSGGSAAAGGARFENLVTAWYAAKALADPNALSALGLPGDSKIVSIRCQTEAPVDDLMLETSTGGFIFVQCKRRVQLGSGTASPLASAIDQFVLQWIVCNQRSESQRWARPLDPARDRLVLAAGATSSAPISEVLPRILRKLRDAGDRGVLQQVASSQEESRVAAQITGLLRRSFTKRSHGDPSADEIRQILHLMWVRRFDVEDEGSDALAAREALANNVLADAAQSPLAFTTLVQIGSRLASERSGMLVTTLRAELRSAGLKLRSPPIYHADIERLRNWTAIKLGQRFAFTRLSSEDPQSSIRRDVFAPLIRSVDQSVLVTGEPGSGKSGVVYELAEYLAKSGKDVVFLPVDRLPVGGTAELTRELRVDNDFTDILANWEGTDTGYVIIDALDAARNFGTQVVFRELVGSILALGGRWQVVASVRTYDLRYGLEWRSLFKGRPPEPTFSNPEFRNVRHVTIPALSDSEIEEVINRLPALRAFLTDSRLPLHALLRTIFNLHLLCQLLDDGAAAELLARIQTQIDLLDSWWQHRILRSDRNHDKRERAVDQLLQQMISARSLQIPRSTLRALSDFDLESLVDLESHGVLRSTDQLDAGSSADRVQFAHHILFDYAVARLTFTRGRNPHVLLKRLTNDRDLALVLRPSLTLAFLDTWSLGLPREHFWTLCFSLARDPNISEVAKLAGPMIAAENAQSIDDLSYLTSRLPKRSDDVSDKAALVCLSHLLGAFFVLANSGAPIAGAGHDVWPKFALALSECDNQRVMFSLRGLLWKLCEKQEGWTPDQRNEIGHAARRLLSYGWSSSSTYDLTLVVTAIDAVLKTFTTDVVASRALLQRALDPKQMQEHAHSEMPWIARGVESIARADPIFVSDIYTAAFGFREESNEKTQMGESQLLPLTSNRRQDFEMSWYTLTEAFPKFVAAHPSEGLRALCKAIEGYFARGRDTLSAPAAFVFDGIEASIASDGSYSWRQLPQRSDALALLPHLDAWFDKLAAKNDAESEFRHALRILARENRLAGIWGSALAAGARHPKAFGRPIASLLAVPEILSPIEITHDAGKCIAAVYPYISIQERNQIETAVLALTGEQGTRAQQILLGTFPDELIASYETRQARDKAAAENKLRPNRPPVEFTSRWGEFGPREYLKEQGVNIEDSRTKRLLDLEDQLKRFRDDYLNAAPAVEDIQAAWPAIDALWTEFLNQQSDGDPRIVEHALSVAAESAARVAKGDLSQPALASVRARTIEILERASHGTDPEFSQQTDEQFNTNAAWGGPSARIAAAQGTMALLGRELDHKLIELAVRLLRDKVAAVRWHIAHLLFVLSKSRPELVWSESRYILDEEENRGVIAGFLGQTLPRLVVLDQKRVNEYAERTLARFRSDDRPGVSECVGLVLGLLWDLHIWRNDESAKSLLFRNIFSGEKHSLLGGLLVRHRDTMVAGALDSPADEGNGARARIFALYQTVAERSFASVAEVLERRKDQRFESWAREEQETIRESFSLLDTIARELYFASGAYSAGNYPNAPASTPNPIQRRFYSDALPLFGLLSRVLAAPVAHHLIETLEFFIPVNPAEVFHLVAASIRTAQTGGYTLEHMGSGLFVRIVERYLADHRDVFSDPLLRNDLIDALDGFVRAGWPDARALTYRIADIWR